jgi:carboxymethylenebutenolidase
MHRAHVGVASVAPLLIALSFGLASGQAAKGGDLTVTSGGQAYKSYLAAPASATKKPAIILIHSFNGLEQGYKDFTDELAKAGFVTLALGWQDYEKEPSDATIMQLVKDGLATLAKRPDVDLNRVGLTGFCAGGRYTMLLLPQMKAFKSGVAWYGFPYQGGTEKKPSKPADFIKDLSAPMLVLHGTKDMASPIGDIYKYAADLDAAGKNFNLKVYQGEPHGFLLREGKVNDTFASRDARDELIAFFGKTLK